MFRVLMGKPRLGAACGYGYCHTSASPFVKWESGACTAEEPPGSPCVGERLRQFFSLDKCLPCLWGLEKWVCVAGARSGWEDASLALK